MTLRILSAVEPLRNTIQEGFYDIMTDLRQQGVLSREAQFVLETIDNYMRCAEISVACQVVANDPDLSLALNALRAGPAPTPERSPQNDDPGKGKGKEMVRQMQHMDK